MLTFLIRQTGHLVIAALLMSANISLSLAETKIYDLRVEYLKNPIGIDLDQPRFSWKMASDGIGVLQKAYEVTISSDEAGTNEVWTSGKVESGKSVHIRYSGPDLQPSSRYYWSVTVWDNADNEISSSEKAFFETGLRNSGWSGAKWIKSISEKKDIDKLLSGTDYVFEVDFQIENIAAGFVFGYENENNYFMWQINLEKIPGKTCLRPHAWTNGSAKSYADKDISDLINIQKGTTYTLRIEVEGSVAKTYINTILIDTRQNPRRATENYGYGLVGFRMAKSETSNTGEEGYFDNVSVTSLDGNDVYIEEDFSTSACLFNNGEVINGRFYVLGYANKPKSMQQEEKPPMVYYDLETDLTLVQDNANIIFSAVDKKNYYMWQINTKRNDGTSYPKLRRHFYRNGTPTTSEISIESHFTREQLLNKELSLKIEVRGKSIRTYLEGKLIDDYTDTNYPTVIKGIGFRAYNGELVNEVAYYDNVKLTQYTNEMKENPNLIITEDFEGTSWAFEGYETIDINGNAKMKIHSLYMKYDSNSETRIFDESMNGIQMFRSTFNLSKDIRLARIYFSSLGVNDVFINGKRVGTPTEKGCVVYNELKPGWTNYSKTVFYNAYDVTNLISKGDNAIGALVSSGWWAGDIAKGEYGSPSLGFIAKLIVEHTDGTNSIIVTNPASWKASTEGAVRLGDIYDGEYYDARRESNWSESEFDDSHWLPVIENKEFGGTIKAFVGPNVEVRPELEQTPITVTKYRGSTPDATGYGMINVAEKKSGTDRLSLSKGDTAIYDMGQNMVGWVRFKVNGSAGTRITMRFAEMLNDDGSKARMNDGPGGSLYRVILREAGATLNYVLKGAPSGEEFSPSMTFFGFRYCEVSTTADVEIEYLKGQVVGTVAEESSSFATNHKDVNQLYSNIVWGQRGNFLSVPTDCPQRSERLGWTGDILAFGQAATYNADLAGFFEKWLGDVRDGQHEDGSYHDLAPRVWKEVGNAAWAEAGIVIPWVTYLMYDNIGVLEDSYDSMEKFMDRQATQQFDGYQYNGGGIKHGDWLAPEGNEDSKKRFIAVCFYAYSAQLMEKMSRALSKSDDDVYAQKANSYSMLYKNIKAEFQTRYVNADGSLKEDGQTVYLLALKLNLFPNEEARMRGVSHLNNLIKLNGNKLGTGFVGTAILNQTLSNAGSTDIAYNLLLQRDNPSWLYSLDQGATTIWERWDSYTKESGFKDTQMNSFNHYAYGAVSEWMYRYMAGINPDESNPGFKHILITPHPDTRTSFPEGQERITSVDAVYGSYYGKIRSAWTIDKQGETTYETTIPANTTAIVTLDVNSQKDILVNGMPAEEATGVISIKRTKEKAHIEIGSGEYSFTTTDKTEIQAVNEKTGKWSLYPNPVKETLNIQSDEEVDSIRIYDLFGGLMYARNDNRPIDMKAFPIGIYMVQVKTATQTSNWKVMKE